MQKKIFYFDDFYAINVRRVAAFGNDNHFRMRITYREKWSELSFHGGLIAHILCYLNIQGFTVSCCDKVNFPSAQLADARLVTVIEKLQLDNIFQHVSLIRVSVSLQIVSDTHINNIVLAARFEVFFPLDVIASAWVEQVRLAQCSYVCGHCVVGGLHLLRPQGSRHLVDGVLVSDVVCQEEGDSLKKFRTFELASVAPSVAFHDVADEYRVVKGFHVSFVMRLVCLL